MKLTRNQLFTAALVLVALILVLLKYWDYLLNPWTRDGQVRAEVIQITPRVAGPIVKLRIVDNQFVKAGDTLFEIDPRTFKANFEQASAAYDKAADNYVAQEKKVDSAEAQVRAAQAKIGQAQSSINQLDATIAKNKAELERQKELLPKRATSKKSLERAQANYEVTVQQREGAEASLRQSQADLAQAEAALAEAKATLGAKGEANASLRQAKAARDEAALNLEFTRIVAPVDGYVTNLNMRLGSQAVANQPALALVDVNSYWVSGYFRETTVGRISAGDKAIVTLMSYPDQPLHGHVDSIGWGIAQEDGSTGFDLLPNISPTFDWIRLAQRVPVRINLDEVPEGVALRVGTTGSVLVKTGSGEPQ